MGKIEYININPAENTVNPEIKIDLRLEAFRGNELPISFSGGLFDENGVRFSDLNNWETDSHEGPALSISGNRSNDIIKLTLYFSLTQKALDHIEEIRDQDKNKDVKLRLNLTVGTIRSKFLEAGIDVKKGEDGLSYLYEKGGLNESNRNINLLAAQRSGEMLEVHYQSLGEQITLTSSDWAQNYCPALGVGRFATVDLYMPDLADAESEWEEYLNDAIQTVQKMETYVHAGEWTSVIEESRKLAEVLREKEHWEELLSHSGYKDDALDRFYKMLQNLFQFTSKFVHRFDLDKNLRDQVKIEKEDAYFIYTTSIGLVNLLSRKVQEFKKTQ